MYESLVYHDGIDYLIKINIIGKVFIGILNENLSYYTLIEIKHKYDDLFRKDLRECLIKSSILYKINFPIKRGNLVFPYIGKIKETDLPSKGCILYNLLDKKYK